MCEMWNLQKLNLQKQFLGGFARVESLKIFQLYSIINKLQGHTLHLIVKDIVQLIVEGNIKANLSMRSILADFIWWTTFLLLKFFE